MKTAMKKNYYSFLFATAVLVLTGCSQDEVLNEVAQKDQAIEFSTYAGRSAESRATVSVTGTIPSFGVFGYYTEDNHWTVGSTANFMINQKVTLETDGDGNKSYVYTPLKYWPNTADHMVSFYAYSPWKDGTTLTDDGGKLKIPFEVAADVPSQTDLLYVNDNTTIDMKKPGVDDKVTFNFSHALARIGFSATYAADQVAAGGTLDQNTTIKITKLTLSTAAGSEFYKSADLKLNYADNKFTASWDNYSTTGNHSTFGIGIIENPVLSSTNKEIGQLNADNNYIMIIPQDLSSENDNLKIDVEYDVITKNVTGNNNDNNESYTIHNKVTKELKGRNFEKGNAYTYRLIIGMTSVKVEASVADWNLVTEVTDVDVPQNKN